MEKPIFIVGLHRTGSTLWHNIIAMSPQVCRMTEIRFLAPRWWHKDVAYFIRTHVGRLDLDENIERMCEMFFSRKPYPGLEGSYWRFENFEHVVDDPDFRRKFIKRIKESDRNLGSIFKTLVEEIPRAERKSRPCVKFPVDLNYVPKLLEWYPDCKVMHITRDPRALAMSKTNDPSGTAMRVSKHPYFSSQIRKAALIFAAIQYVWSSRLHVGYVGLRNYRLFRYEDLLYNTEQVIREVCNFLELDYSSEMLNPEKGKHEHQRSSITGRQQKHFDREAVWRWRDVMPSTDARLVEWLTKTSMRRLGYDASKYSVPERAFSGGGSE